MTSSLDRSGARRRVAELLGGTRLSIVLARGGNDLDIELAAGSELDDYQAGYHVRQHTESMGMPGVDWQPQWFVIGMETLIGDPVFVDLDDPNLPVFTAMHGMGSWRAVRLAPPAGGLPVRKARADVVAGRCHGRLNRARLPRPEELASGF